MNPTTSTQSRPSGMDRGVRFGLVGLAVVAIAACGSDKADTKATTTTAAPAASTPATAAFDLAAYCAVATELDQTESFPPPSALLAKYVGAAPAEISASTKVAAKLIPVADDPITFFATFAEDDVESAVATLDAYESANCGLDKDTELGPGATREIESSANRVDVVATEYAFEAPDTLRAGRTSFVLTNNGKQAHFLDIAKLAPGISVDDLLAAEDSDSMVEGEWESGLAAPGGDDEALTIALEPGTYALTCWVPGPSGDPHALMGMKAEINVS